MAHASRVQAAEAFVKQKLANHDSSHDWWHIHRVRNMTVRLSDHLSVGRWVAEQQLAELAALCHDVADHKYSADPEADRAALQRFLGELALSAEEQELIMYVVDNLGFKEELGRRDGGADGAANSQQRVLAVVQDADRLDAIGAIGIARCLTFGGRFNRVLHDPAVLPREALTQQQYVDKTAQQTTMTHFAEKLFKLKDLMRTAAGREMAEGRHAFMQEFVDRFHEEWQAAA
ncbi:hypothetical protein CHLNCDRAFT_25996 [Chlorella variabilis]|uniref:HD/PDEase domain-containing protein n=1 Tax=Chlorella variabilis TaxID=554065 RepID=E1ZLL3_CHLVA|nr:hypothetical protein CHLNCDRAFT_25996 [Chlorella variabilis]EFN53287.1 hypothetical protein CHLNCDRAFT_25996 [Chlorella variabilis]|eukprot:XP_005845389.1 hypothetical protein CHLNCDRAFT_25996 [Chlorella variabilis]